MLFALTLAFLFGLLRSLENEAFIVHTSLGALEGRQMTSAYSPFGNQTAIIFFGIPFAKPPLGNLRFRGPAPAGKWRGTLDAKQYSAACISNSSVTYKGKDGPISEDCLYLNVFTNSYCMKQKDCAVMAVVHGGGFKAESAVTFKSDVIINNFVGQKRNIVVVTLAYRVGALGWMHLPGDQSSVADNNLGVLDCIEGLRWIQRDIHNFGGRKDRVTLFGHSAGAVMVEFLAVSPLTEQLYQQQVIMSAAETASSKAASTKASRKVAIILGCLPEESSLDNIEKHEIAAAIDCLREKDALEVLKAQLLIDKDAEEFVGPWFDGEILPDYSEKYLRSSSYFKRTTLIGTVTAEMRDSKGAQDSEGNPIVERVSEFCTHMAFDSPYERPQEFQAVCESFHSRKDVPQMMSDWKTFYHNVIDHADANIGPSTKSFVYSFSYKAGKAFNHYRPDRNNEASSPSHSEEFVYILGINRGLFEEKDYVIEKIFSGMVANFVNSGDPSPSEEQKWPVWSEQGNEFFHIDFDENFEMPGAEEGYYEEADLFWNEIVPRFAGKNLHGEKYPPGYDTFSCRSVIIPLGSHWSNRSIAHEKTFEAEEASYKQWTEFLLSQIKQLLENPDGLKRESLNHFAMDGHFGKAIGFPSWVILISGVTVVVLTCCIGLLKFLAWQRSRAAYQPLL
ncbi:unnamed protein product [Caenorhabditis auriculariae]|uniref:Carboxylic ester hydrolase n=1 Tax=Caenorhabditis auriculariae TaxID=2777116 RepID=A0A8S1GX72_9PELO|nr:unnamed protein product [Caenorhabditis auriculariae]